MPRLTVFDTREIKNFEEPPKFDIEQRHKHFVITEQLSTLIKNIKAPTNKVCLVLQWGYFRASGRFFSYKHFRKADIEYITKALQIPLSEIDIEYYSSQRKTSRHHEKTILAAMGFKPYDYNAKEFLNENIKQLVSKQMQPSEIIYYLSSQLNQQKIEIPGYYTFVETITKSYNIFETNLLLSIENAITSEHKSMLDSLFIADETHSLLSKWKHISQASEVKSIRESVIVFEEIKKFFHKITPLLDAMNLSTQSCEYYATWVKKAKLSQIKQFPNKTKLYLHLLAFIQHQFYIRHDILLDVFLKSVQLIRNRAIKKLIAKDKAKRKERQVAVEELFCEQENLQLLLNSITQIINLGPMTNDGKIDAIKALLDKRESHQPTAKDNILTKKQRITTLLADDDFGALEDVSLGLQNRVNGIVNQMCFNEETSDKNLIKAINYFKNNTIKEGAPICFLKPIEKKAILDGNGKFRISLYKSLLFIKMADAIKAGYLNLRYSYRYKAIQDYLVNKTHWDSNREKLLNIAGLSQFANSDGVINELKEQLDIKYHETNKNINNGNNLYIKFDKQNKVVLKTPQRDKDSTETLRSVLAGAGHVSIIQVLKDINNATHFTDSFKHYSTKHHKLKPDVDTLIAGLMGHGHNIGTHKMGEISIGINSNVLTQVSNWFFTDTNLTAVNQTLVSFINKLSLPKVFLKNDGSNHTSSDGRKIGVAVDCLLASYSFKYFGKDKGVSLYIFLDQQQTLYYTTVFSSSERDAAYVLDGLLHNDEIKSTIHSTDTHGFTETVFAASHFVGTSFAPRFKNIKRQSIYAFSTKKTYEKIGYKVLPSRTINQYIIKENWEDILRFMVTIKLKEATASQLFKRLSSYAKDHPLYKAIKEFGRIIKSLFILTYIDDVELRQQIELQLNRVELSNKFGRAVFFANKGEFKVGTKEEQKIITLCKMIIQNAIVLWNYLYLSKLLVENKDLQECQLLVNTIKYSSVLSWGHMNMSGVYDFRENVTNTQLFDVVKLLALKLDFKPAKVTAM